MCWKGTFLRLIGIGLVLTEAGSPPADHAFHVSQLNIILGRTDPLLEVFADGLRDGHYDPASIEYVFYLRYGQGKLRLKSADILR